MRTKIYQHGGTQQDAQAWSGLMQRALDLQIRAAKATITAASSIWLHPPVPQFPPLQVIKLEILQWGLKDWGGEE